VYCAKVSGTPGATDAEINAACFAQQQLTINKNNPNLKEETSLFWNVGFLTEPKKDWNIEGNFWVARIKDRVGAIDVSYLTQAEAEYTAQLGQAAAAEKMLNDYGVIVHRAPNGALVDIVMPSAFNLPEEVKKGIDLRISHDMKFNVAGVPFGGSISVDHVHFLKSQSEDFPGLGITSNRNVDWKNNITLALNKNYHTGRVVIRTVSGGDRDASYYESGWGSLPTFTTYDVVYSYGNLFGGTLNAGIKNLAAYNTPRDYTIQAPSDQIADTVYDTVGRQYFLGYQYTF
jgi:outer membrane receptor for ferrienterochelin and colicin